MSIRIGVPAETKKGERRVALTPAAVDALRGDGHEVVVERGAGSGSAFTDDQYVAAGATLVDVETAWSADLVVKVKEPQQHEFGHLHAGTVLFTFLHLAAYPEVAAALMRSDCTAIAYETVHASDGTLPLLSPMSEIAGRMATQAGARFLEVEQGGRGVLLGGAVGVARGNVVVIGAGVSGTAAAVVAAGMGARVTVFDLSPDRLRQVARMDGGHRIETRISTPLELQEEVERADLVIGAVLLPGARAPIVLDRTAISQMAAGSVLVDIAIDQGGCFETSRETTHADPIYDVDGVTHYAVGNIPGAVPRTSTLALSGATLPYVRRVAAQGFDDAASSDPGLASGLNVRRGEVVNPTVLQALTA